MALKSMNIPTRNYQVGSNTIPAQTVPAGVVRMDIILDTTNWTNPASKLEFAIELSRDGGATWMGGGSLDMQCREDGTFRDRAGNILATVTASFTWPAGATHIRGTYVISGAAIRTGGAIEVS